MSGLLAIAQPLVDLAKSVMTQDRGVTISDIIPRNDQWNNKVWEVNDSLACMYKNDNISFIDHSGPIDPAQNLNNSKLHLNIKGSNNLWDNFARYLKSFSSWKSDTQSYTQIRHDKSIIGKTPPIARDENLRFSGSFDNISWSSIKNNTDILMILETKINNSFPIMQFHIEGYCIYRLNRNEYGGGILVYVQEDISSKLIPMQRSPIEGFFIELNLRCKKWLFSCSYNPHRSLISENLSIIGKDLDLLSANFDQIFLMGNFNPEPHDHFLMDFCDENNLKNLIKVPTYVKNSERPTSIDLMLTNSYKSFQNSCAIETGLSDFHKMIATILKTYFQKKRTKDNTTSRL